MVISPTRRGNGGGNGGVGPAGCEYLCFLTLEHSRTVHCNQAYYGPFSGSGVTPGDKGVSAVVGVGGIGPVGGVYGSSGGVTGGH